MGFILSIKLLHCGRDLRSLLTNPWELILAANTCMCPTYNYNINNLRAKECILPNELGSHMFPIAGS